MGATIDKDVLLKRLHEAGGCDAEPDSYVDGWDKAITHAIEIVQVLPENGGWHPVSELAPAGEPLIVTVLDKTFGSRGEYKLVYPVFYRKSHVYNRWAFFQYGTEDGVIGPGTEYCEVTAWTFFPEPYKGR